MGEQEDRMSDKRKTRPSRQARERVCKSNDSVSQDAACAIIAAALIIIAVLVVPHLLYDYLAPLKGWC